MKIMVLAGGFDQIALIKELKKRNHEILLADYFDDPPAKKYADVFYQVSTLDEEKIYEIANREKVDLITTACTDQALLTVARVSERMDLPCYITSAQALKVTNKFYMKQLFVKHSVTTAKFQVFDNADEINDQIEMIEEYPVIVKPCDCNSSKGVVKITEKSGLREALENAYCLSRSKKVIIEQYIEGIEISIDAWVKDKEPVVLSVSETKKIKENADNFTICSSSYPVYMTTEQTENMKNEILKIVEAFGVENGPLLVQAIIKENDVYVVEFSMRMGGGTKYKLIQYMSGINIMEKYTEFVLQGGGTLPCVKNSEQCYELDYLYAYNGKIDRLEYFDEIKDSGAAKEIFFYKKPGNVITQKITSSDRVAGILIEGTDYEEIMFKRRNVLSSVKILDETGKDLLYRGCFEEKECL